MRNKKKDKGRLRKEGFWSEDSVPIANDEPWDGQEEFLERLIHLEESLLSEYQRYVDAYNDGREMRNPGHVIGYRGFSICRICGCGNGSLEFRRHGWVWPSGFRHYIEVHNVKPSDDFIEFILSFDTD